MACLVTTAFFFLMRVGEVTETRGNRNSAVAGFFWEHVMFLDENHDEVSLGEIVNPVRRAAVRWVQVEWWRTKMDPLARGRRRALYVTDLPWCVVATLLTLARKVLEADVREYARRGASDPVAAAVGNVKGKPVFTDYKGRAMSDSLFRRKFKQVTRGLGFPKEKQRPHKGLRGGGRTALGAAGLSKQTKNIIMRLAEQSDVGDKVYENWQRSEVKQVARAMTMASQKANQQMALR